MVSLSEYFKYVAVMAIVTYMLRALPFVLVKKKIENIYVRSFLEYIPYGVLASMTFPAVFTSAGGLAPSLAGMTIAIILSCHKKSLLTVAIGAVLMAGAVTIAMSFAQ